MRRAIAVSPHLDDAVFSAGGTLAVLAAAGWRVRVITCFTASVADPSPFALSTQLDKGLAADVDYMALRRAEDGAALALLGAPSRPIGPVHLPLPEAPHRGYVSAPDLFAGQHADDGIAGPLCDAVAPYLRDADLVLAPQAIGDHVDHRVVVDVVAALRPDALFWRDTPYVLRRPDAPAWQSVPGGAEQPVYVGAQLDIKAAAASCYTTQLGFQFGGPDRVAADLEALARKEADRVGASGPCEVFTGSRR